MSFSPLSSLAESFKEQGNAYYSKKDYSQAFNYYTKAIGEYTWWLDFKLSHCWL